jgi:DNA-binding transcriptional LysR family regulator
MTLDQIKTFLWVARLGGFRRAAAQLNLSQPAVSARISTLEAELRVSLFERDAKSLTLTRNGTLLMSYAEQMLFVQEEIRRRVANAAEMDGLFRIGASETIAQSWLPDFLKAFSQAYPRISLDLTVDISRDLREGLLTRQLDIAFLMGPVSDFSVENVALPKINLTWFKSCSAGPIDLTKTPIISFSSNTRPYRELMSELTRTLGPSIRVFSSASLSASLQMIAAGIAVGPYPRSLAANLIATGQIEEFDAGMTANPLEFTASYMAEPHDFLSESAAKMARDVALAWDAREDITLAD